MENFALFQVLWMTSVIAIVAIIISASTLANSSTQVQLSTQNSLANPGIVNGTFAQTVCSCKNDWSVATNERTLSDTYLAQSEPLFLHWS